MRWLLAGVLTAALLGTGAPALQAQVQIHGRVVEDDTGTPIAGASVIAIDPMGRNVARRITDQHGRFEFVVRGSGPIRLRSDRMGYRATTTPPLHFERFDFFRVEIRLDIEAVVLAPLEVIARSGPERSPVLHDFDHRLARGLGTYFTRADIERIRPSYVTDLLATVPGVRLESSGRGSRRVVYMTRAISGARDCPAQVFVDGFLLNRRLGSGSESGFAIDDAVPPTAIEGIEVYRGLSGVPAEFLTPESQCGVVAIWTRRGR